MLVDFALYTPMFLSFAWALMLIISSRTNRARLFLGLFMFTVSLIFLSHVIYYHHLKSIYLHFDLIFIFGSLSIFPIYHWYMKILTFRSEIDFRDMKLLFPAFAMLIATYVCYWLMNPALKTLYINKYLYGDGQWQGSPILIKIQLVLCYTLQLLYFFQIIFSFLKIRVFIANYNENIANFYSNLEDKTLEWPKIILYSFVVTSLFSMVTNFLGRSFFDKYPLLLLFTGLGYSLFLFVLGYLGYMQNHTVVMLEDDSVILVENETENPTNKKIKSQLEKLFEKEKAYKNKELKISDIASKLNTNRTYISSFINSEYGCSFSTFVNSYRVEEAKKLMTNEEFADFTLDHIAEQAGFGSLNSFIRVFKDVTNNTPGQYRKTFL